MCQNFFLKKNLQFCQRILTTEQISKLLNFNPYFKLPNRNLKQNSGILLVKLPKKCHFVGIIPTDLQSAYVPYLYIGIKSNLIIGDYPDVD